MKLYLSTPEVPFNVYRSAVEARMTIDNYVERKGRHGGASLEFNGYGGPIHSCRRPNTRDYSVRSTEYAATWDQWGVLLSDLFFRDPLMKVGSYKRPYYRDADDFHWQTMDRFKRVFTLDSLDDFHGDHRWEFSGIVGAQSCRNCSAVQRWSTS